MKFHSFLKALHKSSIALLVFPLIKSSTMFPEAKKLFLVSHRRVRTNLQSLQPNTLLRSFTTRHEERFLVW